MKKTFLMKLIFGIKAEKNEQIMSEKTHQYGIILRWFLLLKIVSCLTTVFFFGLNHCAAKYTLKLSQNALFAVIREKLTDRANVALTHSLLEV